MLAIYGEGELPVNVKQGDAPILNFWCRVRRFDGSLEPIDLTGRWIRLYVKKLPTDPDGAPVANGQINGPPESGDCSFQLTSATTAQAGRFFYAVRVGLATPAYGPLLVAST